MEKIEKRKIICIICPVGCEIIVERSENGSLKVSGNRCKRGEEYAIQEVTNPLRTLITVVKVRGGHLPVVAVKTEKPIPKKLLMEAVRLLSEIEVEAPVRIGDVIVQDLLGTGVRVVATNNIFKKTSSN